MGMVGRVRGEAMDGRRKEGQPATCKLFFHHRTSQCPKHFMCINLNNINDFYTYEVGNITIFRDEENKPTEVNEVVQSHS